jgi:hypothetical protein
MNDKAKKVLKDVPIYIVLVLLVFLIRGSSLESEELIKNEKMDVTTYKAMLINTLAQNQLSSFEQFTELINSKGQYEEPQHFVFKNNQGQLRVDKENGQLYLYDDNDFLEVIYFWCKMRKYFY